MQNDSFNSIQLVRFMLVKFLYCDMHLDAKFLPRVKDQIHREVINEMVNRCKQCTVNSILINLINDLLVYVRLDRSQQVGFSAVGRFPLCCLCRRSQNRSHRDFVHCHRVMLSPSSVIPKRESFDEFHLR